MYALQTDIASIGKHIASLEDNHLSARAFEEMGKSPRQSATRIGDKRIDSANERILSAINIVLVGLAAVIRCSLVELCDRHRTDVSTFSDAGVTTLVIEPVASDDTYGARRLFYTPEGHTRPRCGG